MLKGQDTSWEDAGKYFPGPSFPAVAARNISYQEVQYTARVVTLCILDPEVYRSKKIFYFCLSLPFTPPCGTGLPLQRETFNPQSHVSKVEPPSKCSRLPLLLPRQ